MITLALATDVIPSCQLEITFQLAPELGAARRSMYCVRGGERGENQTRSQNYYISVTNCKLINIMRDPAHCTVSLNFLIA